MTILAAVIVGGCYKVTPNKAYTAADHVTFTPAQIATAQAGVRQVLKDPDSARFGRVSATQNDPGTVAVCGYVNARNSFGGYTGDVLYMGLLEGASFSVLKIGNMQSSWEAERLCRKYGVNDFPCESCQFH